MGRATQLATYRGATKVTCYKQKDAPTFSTPHLKLLGVQYRPEEKDLSAVLINGNEQAQSTLSRAEAVMLTALQGKTLTYNALVQAGMGGEEQVLSKTAAQRAIKKLLASGRVVKTGKLYSQAASNEQEGDNTDLG